MLATSIQWLEALQYAIDDERSVLVAYGDQISMALRVTRQRGRAVRLGDIDANWVASDALDDPVQLKVLQREDSQVTIVARCDNPVLLPV